MIGGFKIAHIRQYVQPGVFGDAQIRVCWVSKREPGISIETYSLTTIRTLLAQGDHLSLLSRCELSFEERIGLLTRIQFTSIDPPASLGVTTRAGWLPSELQTGFLAVLREHARSLNTPIECAGPRDHKLAANAD